jgi:hypothetical protein
MEEAEGRAIAVPVKVLPLIVALAALVVFLVVRSRRAAPEESALQPVVNAINEAELPERARVMLQTAVDEVRHALTNLREMTSQSAESP